MKKRIHECMKTYICICVYTCTYTYIYIYVYVCVYIYIYFFLQVHFVCVCVCVSGCLSFLQLLDLSMCVDRFSCLFIFACAYDLLSYIHVVWQL